MAIIVNNWLKKIILREPVTLSEADVSISWQLVGDGQIQREFTPAQVRLMLSMMLMINVVVNASKIQRIF